EAIAAEWRTVTRTIDPRAMPMTGLSNGAIDRIEPELETFKQGLARYADADLACYRAETPRELVVRQEIAWDPLLDWARKRYDIDFVTTSGLLHVAQPAAVVAQLSAAILALDAFHLAGLSQLATIGGSLIGALAVLEKAITPNEAWDAISIDERWQIERWGADMEAGAAIENRRRDFLAAAHFLDLLG
ncbi:MAG TPA: ATP12 family protein, partial [Sphingomicrobium sp.]|nr:ATP12 family protein [Sphingomicrobium sp.]